MSAKTVSKKHRRCEMSEDNVQKEAKWKALEKSLKEQGVQDVEQVIYALRMLEGWGQIILVDQKKKEDQKQ